MKWLIKNAHLLAPGSPFDDQLNDLLVVEGRIEQIQPGIKDSEANVFDASGAYLSPGWMDIGCFNGDPGFEHREDLNSLAAAAIAGGYTAIAPLPNTFPPVENQADIYYLRNHPVAETIDVFPIAAATEGTEGKAITEMIDLRHAGAVAFSDGLKSIQHGGVMIRALEYVRQFDGLLINHPDDHLLSGGGQLHEGRESTLLGLPGIPSVAEEMMLYRDLRLVEYTRSRLLVAAISSVGSVELIRRAKAQSLDVFASVPVMNLAFDVSGMADFDSNKKVLPPLRTAADKEGLIEGILDDTIDCIVSGHLPVEEDHKIKEFPYTAFGAIGLETTFALANQVLSSRAGIRKIVDKLSYGPRRVLGLPVPEINTGVPANFTIFDPEMVCTFTRKNVQSKSYNTPLLGRELRGSILATFLREQVHLNKK